MSIGAYTTESNQDVLSGLKTREGGLTGAEVQVRLGEYGPNEIAVHDVTWYEVLFRQLKSPFIWMLFGAALLAFFLGEKSDGIIIVVFVGVNTLISFFQEYHSERSVALLKKTLAPKARVMRNGTETEIPARELVPGDIMLVEAGDILDADVRFIEAVGLSINESALTGESAPMAKKAAPIKVEAKEFSDAVNRGFSGTTVASGRGTAVVVATGTKTEIGAIGTLAAEAEHPSAFEASIRLFSKFILKMTAIILVILLVVNLTIKGTQNIVELLLFAVALAISIIPEALPVVTTLSLSKGALALAHNHVVVKRLSAIEDLGSIEVLCTDKTGTLTENVLRVAEVHAADQSACLRAAALAAGKDIAHGAAAIDSFDKAVWEKLAKPELDAIAHFARVESIPFDPDRRRTTVVVREGAGVSAGALTLISRGAPETILGLSTASAEEKAAVLAWTAEQGKLGRRTLALAQGSCSKPERCQAEEKKLTFLGCVSFVDPIKETTKAAISEAERLGIRIVILTGDGPDVSGAVAHDVGIIASAGDVIAEADFMALSPEQQAETVKKTSVFARMSPAGKYRVIELLSKEHIVGYLGDGINDAPALRVASVGLVVENASDIAREAADVILLNRSLHVIIGGIRSGRSVFENTVKYLKTTLISSFGNFYTIAIAELILPYLPMLPIQILLLNLLTDYPMLAIATDTVDSRDVRVPRRYNVRDIVLISIVLGLVSTLFDFIFFSVFRHAQPAVLETNWFIGSVLTEVVLLYAIRTRMEFWKAKRPSTILNILSVSAVAIAIGLPFSALGGRLFKFVVPSAANVLIIALIVVLYFIASEAMKLVYYRFWEHNGTDALTVRHPAKRARRA